MLVYALHSPGKQCYSPIRDLQQFKSRAQQFKNLSTTKLQGIPEELREYVKLLLNFTPEIRPDAHQFMKVADWHWLSKIADLQHFWWCRFRILTMWEWKLWRTLTPCFSGTIYKSPSFIKGYRKLWRNFRIG